MLIHHSKKLLEISSIVLTIGVGAIGLAACGGSANPSGGSSDGSGGGLVTKATGGRAIFMTAGCAKCHTLKSASATGKVGPNLDSLQPSTAIVRFQVEHGGGVMPSFKGKLTAAQINAVATFVSSTAGH